MFPTGHYGVAMVLAAPVTSFLGRKAGTVFTTFVLLTAVLPDLDRHLPFVTHHGVTHTFLFAVVAAIVVGPLAAVAYLVYVGQVGPPQSPKLTAENVFVWAGAGAFLGVASHVLADVLVLLPGSQPVSPFWPVFARKIRVEIVSLGGPVRNASLLLVGLTIQILVYREK